MNSIISIIVPIYNTCKYLFTCIESLVNQKFERQEILLIDDGSSDMSGIMSDCFAIYDSRIVVCHKKNGGVSQSRNFGIDISNGDYLSFVDSDDWIDSEANDKLYNNLNEFKSECSAVDFSSKTSTNNSFTYLFDRYNAIENILTQHDIKESVCAKLFIKEKFDYRFNESITNGEDLLVLIQYLLNSIGILYDSSPCYHYTNRPQSAVHQYRCNQWTILRAYNRIISILNIQYNDLSQIAKVILCQQIINISYSAIDNNKFGKNEFNLLCDALNYYSDSFELIPLQKKIAIIFLHLGRIPYIAFRKIRKIFLKLHN